MENEIKKLFMKQVKWAKSACDIISKMSDEDLYDVMHHTHCKNCDRDYNPLPLLFTAGFDILKFCSSKCSNGFKKNPSNIFKKES